MLYLILKYKIFMLYYRLVCVQIIVNYELKYDTEKSLYNNAVV